MCFLQFPNMAEVNGAPALNLHLDEVTGERVSKSELKKRQKQRESEARKKEKAASAPMPVRQKATSEEDLTPNVCLSTSDL